MALFARDDGGRDPARSDGRALRLLRRPLDGELGGRGRSAILAVAFAALPLLPEGDLSTDEWLGLGLGLALLACAGLAVAVLALAREVGMLRLRLGPEAALEIPEEGPALGSRSAAISRFEPGPEAGLALAVFTSAGCHVCRALEPTIATLASEPSIAVRTFEEAAEPGLDRARDTGSPFAVAFDLEGGAGEGNLQ